MRFVAIQSTEGRELAKNNQVDPDDPSTFLLVINDRVFEIVQMPWSRLSAMLAARREHYYRFGSCRAGYGIGSMPGLPKTGTGFSAKRTAASSLPLKRRARFVLPEPELAG